MEAGEKGKIENSGDIEVSEHFNSPSKGRRDFLSLVADMIGFIAEEPSAKYSIVIGTDSEFLRNAGQIDKRKPVLAVKKEGVGIADFVNVITIHRIGNGGRYFWKRMPAVKTFDRHDRMLKEAYFSIETANKLVSELREKLNGYFYDLEIHLDIGHNGPTKDMISEIVGMVTGNGFKARIKPESYAAMTVADRYV